MKEVFEESQNNRIQETSDDSKEIDIENSENTLSEEYKKQTTERIEKDETLDPDTRKNAITAIKLFSIAYNDAIKIAEVVNLLWEGERKFENKKYYTHRTKGRDNVFIEKIFPIAKEYRNIKSINEIPKDVIVDIKDFKRSYNEQLEIYKFKQDEKSSELFNYVSEKVKEAGSNLENLNDQEWQQILNKLDFVNINLETLKKKTQKNIAVWITKGLIDYNEKQDNIKKSEENGFNIEGFENCDEVSNKEVEKFLYDTLGKNLLVKALVSKLTYSSKFATGDINGNELFLDEKDYLELKDKNRSIEEKRFLGGSGVSHSNFKETTPIMLYNHKYKDLSVRHELDNYPENKKDKAFILCSLIHEIGGHNFYNLILKLSDRKEYEKVCNEEKNNECVTFYISECKKGKRKVITNIYDEDFAESMRRFMSDYEDFKQEFLMRTEFIEKKFPEIKKNGIKNFIGGDFGID